MRRNAACQGKLTGMPDPNPYDDSYDRHLLILPSYNEKPPHARWDHRIKLPESLRSATMEFLIQKQQAKWIEPNSMLRPAIYHGLHHLGVILGDGRLPRIAAEYRGAMEARNMLSALTDKREMMEAFREVARTVTTPHDAREHATRMRAVRDMQPDPHVVEELDELIKRLEEKM